MKRFTIGVCIILIMIIICILLHENFYDRKRGAFLIEKYCIWIKDYSFTLYTQRRNKFLTWDCYSLNYLLFNIIDYFSSYRSFKFLFSFSLMKELIKSYWYRIANLVVYFLFRLLSFKMILLVRLSFK